MEEPGNICFNDQLLDHIRLNRYVEARLMLNQELAQAHDGWRTLLHHAAWCDNDDIALELIRLGAEVDRSGSEGNTPLMVAVQEENPCTVRVLLDANASIYVVNDDGRNALQMALELDHFKSHFNEYRRIFVDEIIEAFTRRLKTEARTTEELAERLIVGGCNMHHVANLRDVDLMKCMLERGIDVNSRGFNKRSAVHTAADLDDLNMAMWLVKNGADVNALDEDEYTALLIAAENGSISMIKILLEHGADPNCKDTLLERTPLFEVYSSMEERPEKQSVECVELLIQYNAIPQNSPQIICTMFDFALLASSGKMISILIGHLAVLEMRGMAITKSVMYCKNERLQFSREIFENFYERCLQMLKIEIFGEMSLFDLLTTSEYKMRLCVRDETFLLKIGDFFLHYSLSEIFPCHDKLLTMRIFTAVSVVALENDAIPVICKIFNGNYNQCYYFARKVVSYLSEHDLEQLVRV